MFQRKILITMSRPPQINTFSCEKTEIPNNVKAFS